MIHFSGQGILLDIEGTTSSLHFVKEVLFPYARNNLSTHLRNLWNHADMSRIRQELAQQFGKASFEEWTGGKGMPPEHRLVQMRETLFELMDQDSKTGPLKELQGLIWKKGYDDGTLRSHIYSEVPRVLKEWKLAGKDIRIYSSGSVQAQMQFFQHVNNGTSAGADLTHRFSGYYDTTTGPKKEADSYRKIAGFFGLPAASILFLSDSVDELDAARVAGMQTGLVCRPENPPIEDDRKHPRLNTFDDIVLG